MFITAICVLFLNWHKFKKRWADVFQIYPNAIHLNPLQFCPSMPLLGFPVFCLSSSIVLNRYFHILDNSMTIWSVLKLPKIEWPSPFKDCVLRSFLDTFIENFLASYSQPILIQFSSLKARLHRRFLSRKLDLSSNFKTRTCKPGAIFSAISRRDIAVVSNMFETCCNFSATKIASSFRDKNRLCKRTLRLYTRLAPGTVMTIT